MVSHVSFLSNFLSLLLSSNSSLQCYFFSHSPHGSFFSSSLLSHSLYLFSLSLSPPSFIISCSFSLILSCAYLSPPCFSFYVHRFCFWFFFQIPDSLSLFLTHSLSFSLSPISSSLLHSLSFFLLLSLSLSICLSFLSHSLVVFLHFFHLVFLCVNSWDAPVKGYHSNVQFEEVVTHVLVLLRGDGSTYPLSLSYALSPFTPQDPR